MLTNVCEPGPVGPLLPVLLMFLKLLGPWRNWVHPGLSLLTLDNTLQTCQTVKSVEVRDCLFPLCHPPSGASHNKVGQARTPDTAVPGGTAFAGLTVPPHAHTRNHFSQGGSQGDFSTPMCPWGMPGSGFFSQNVPCGLFQGLFNLALSGITQCLGHIFSF